MIDVFVKLTTAGVDTGPFNISAYAAPTWTPVAVDVSRNNLITTGMTYSVADNTTIIRVTSNNENCTNYIQLLIGTTTTTTTLIEDTTTTTTSDIPGTTTTTTALPCHGYNVNNYSGNPEDFNYVDCNGDAQVESVPATSGYIEVCGRSYTENASLNVEYVETCSSGTTTTTTTATPTTTTTTTATPTTTTTTTTADAGTTTTTTSTSSTTTTTTTTTEASTTTTTTTEAPVECFAVPDIGWSDVGGLAACAAAKNLTVYTEISSFADAEFLWTGSPCYGSGSNYAIAGYYSNGLVWRYWSGTAFTSNGSCS